MAYLELNLVRDVKNIKNGFLKYVFRKKKRKTRENVLCCLMRWVLTENAEKVEQNVFFATVFSDKTAA